MAGKTEVGQKAKKKKGVFAGIALGIFLAVMGVAILPVTLLLIVGLIPAVVAFFTDASRERMLGMTVLVLNGAGVLPLLVKLWKTGCTVQRALDILTDPMMLLFILVPSGCGWLLYYFTPQLVVGIMKRKAEMRIRTLKKYQIELVEQWGTAVAGTLDPPKSQTTPETEKSPSQ